MKILIVSGSRADAGLLAPITELLKADPYFKVSELSLRDMPFAMASVMFASNHGPCDLMLCLGDRFEILAACCAAHLERIPIAHIAGGDVTLGSYDDAMRDCISRMACLHFTTSAESNKRLAFMPNIHGPIYMVGNPSIDVIRAGKWKGPRPIEEPYVVISYQAETVDADLAGTKAALQEICGSLDYGKHWVFIMPNADRHSDFIRAFIDAWCLGGHRNSIYNSLPHADFLSLLYHADEFIGNSSAMLYEAPELGVKCRMIGKRQQGRVAPSREPGACQRIVDVLKRWKA